MKIAKIILFYFILLNLSFSQNNEETKKSESKLPKFIELLPKIINIAENSSEFNKIATDRSPATFNITSPDSGNVSFLTDIAIKSSLLNSFKIAVSEKNSFNLSPYIELHKNTLISSEQDLFKYGMIISDKLKEITNYRLMLNLSLNFNDSRNYIDNLWAVQASSEFTFTFDILNDSDPFRFILPSLNPIVIIKPDFLAYQYVPTFCIEYNNIYTANTDNYKGIIYANVYKIYSTIYLFKQIMGISGDFQWGNNFSNNTANLIKTFNYQKLSLNINFFKNISDNIQLLAGLDYVNGENPWVGLSKQHYWQYGLKLKL